MNNNIKALIFSLLLVPAWGLTMINNQFTGPWSVFIAFCSTLVLIWGIFLNPTNPLSTQGKVLLLFGPLCYLVLSYIVMDGPIYFYLLSPLLFGSLLLIGFVFISKKISSYHFFGYFFIIYLYSFFVYPAFVNSMDLDESTELFKKSTLSTYTIDPDSIILFSKDGEKTLREIGLPLIVKTWNEKCIPCLISMEDLDTLLSHQIETNHIFLYGNMGKVNMKFDDVFQFYKINERDRIFLDSNNDFLTSLGIKSFPHFIFIDKDGKIIEVFSGYLPKYKNEYFDKILQLDKLLSE
jgi:hypothetical protein